MDETIDRELVGITHLRCDIIDKIKYKQYKDEILVNLRNGVKIGDYTSFTVDSVDNILRLQGCLYVSNVNSLQQELMVECHSSKYFVHLGFTNMYKDLKKHYR